jgi:hypothetical protein
MARNEARSSAVVRLALAALLSLSYTSIFATPITYTATYTITSIGMPDSSVVLPPAWGALQVGDHVYGVFTWDSDTGQIVAPHTYSPGGVVAYNFTVGNASISSSAGLGMWASRYDFSSDLMLIQHPAIPSISPYFFDEIILGFSCGQWTSLAGLPTTLDCGTGLQGSFRLTPSPAPATFDLQAGLLSIQMVPEAGTLELFMLGVAGLGLSRRRKAN